MHPNQSNAHPQILFIENLFLYYLSIYAQAFHTFCPSDFPQKPCIWTYPHTCHMSHPSHPSRLHTQITLGWRAQITEVLILKLSSVSRYFLPLKPKYLPQHPILVNPFLLMWETINSVLGLKHLSWHPILQYLAHNFIAKLLTESLYSDFTWKPPAE
jgi:hypothetical protein